MNEPESLQAVLRIRDVRDATALAAPLFEECFAQPFPTPREDCGLPFPTPPQAWHQYVAQYAWPDGEAETVGFCNWIRHGEVYLEGGMCVRESIYRRMPRAHFRECRGQGGIAQMMMATAARELADCTAWFGYCGDAKAMAVDLRAGYEKTHHPLVIVKWFRDPGAEEKRALVERIAAIGPF